MKEGFEGNCGGLKMPWPYFRTLDRALEKSCRLIGFCLLLR